MIQTSEECWGHRDCGWCTKGDCDCRCHSGNLIESEVQVIIAPGIEEDSWLNRGDEEFEQFKKGYAYASTQTMAIPGLAKIHPEELYYVWSAIKRGIEKEVNSEHTRQTQGTEGPSSTQENQQAASQTGEETDSQGLS